MSIFVCHAAGKGEPTRNELVTDSSAECCFRNRDVEYRSHCPFHWICCRCHETGVAVAKCVADTTSRHAAKECGLRLVTGNVQSAGKATREGYRKTLPPVRPNLGRCPSVSHLHCCFPLCCRRNRWKCCYCCCCYLRIRRFGMNSSLKQTIMSLPDDTQPLQPLYG